MANEQSESHIPSLGELRWQCRRGKLELDIALEGYLDKHFANSSETERRAFVALLQAEDQDIFDWVIRGIAPPSEGIVEIVRKIRSA